MVHNNWLSKTHNDSQPMAQHSTPGQWFWISVCYIEPLIVNHCELSWASGCETLWVMLSSVCRNCDVLCWGSWCESLWFMLSQWLWIMVCYSVQIGVNHGELCWTRCWQSECIILSQWSLAQHSSSWLTTTCSAWFTHTDSAYHSMIYTHWFSIAHHDSLPLTQNNTQWFPHTC
jgi:hypothetical protein